MNQEEKREQLNEIWDSLNESSIEYLDSEFNKIAPKLTEFLILSVLNDDEIDIGTFGDEKTEGACITYDVYNTDKMLSLKYGKNSNWGIELILYDWEGEEKKYFYPINGEEIKVIPEGLSIIMTEVAKKGRGKVIRVSALPK